MEELGFDGVINYREQDVDAALDELVPSGVDLLFENVGGPVLQSTIDHMSAHGTIVLCGLISQHNLEMGSVQGTNLLRVIGKHLTIRGFTMTDQLDRFGEFVGHLAGYLAAGALKCRVHVVDGLEAAPEAVTRLLRGEHRGKLLVRLNQG